MSATTTCRSCGDQTENYSGFCNKGICTIAEEGYHLGFREGMHGRDVSARDLAEPVQSRWFVKGDM